MSMMLTSAGLGLLARIIAGRRTLTFTKIRLGDAVKNNVIQNPSPDQILNLENLFHEVNFSVPIVEIRTAGNGTVIVVGKINNQNLTTGFFAREIGLYAYDADLDVDILYAYSNQGELASFIPAGGADTLMDVALNLITVVSNAQNVTAKIDASGVYISRSELTSHINSTTPHPNIPKVSNEVETSNWFWSTGSDNQLHAISRDNLSKQILGSHASELPVLSNRIAQTEINIANLYMQLDAEKDLGLQANLLLVEDFIDCDTVDLFSIKVNDEVAGVNNVCVDNIDGIIEGCMYFLSDGTRSQQVRVQSIAKNENLYVVIFDDTLKYTFNLPKTTLYRSTGLVYDNKLDGAGDLRSSTYRFSDVWTGATASAAQTLNLTTTQANSKNLTLSGDYGFTAAGEFTLN